LELAMPPADGGPSQGRRMSCDWRRAVGPYWVDRRASTWGFNACSLH